MRPPSPKQRQGEKRRDWYPYYAGFTSEFAADVFARHLSGASEILDPWNGGGTTTAVGASLGHRCTGLDINPVLTVVARGRTCPSSLQGSLEALGQEIVRAAPDAISTEGSDTLAGWLRLPAVRAIRSLQQAIHDVVIDEPEFSTRLRDDVTSACEGMPVLAAFFYNALFGAVRDLLMPFRASNPSWVRSPATSSHRLNPSREALADRFLDRVQYFSERLSVTSRRASEAVTIRTASVLNLNRQNEFDGCFSSPPYATRLDYVKNSLPELAVLGMGSDALLRLRRSTTGTPVVKGTVRRPYEELVSLRAREAYEAVVGHESHGSANYYAPWLGNYFADLQDSFQNIARAVRPSGKICIVVQDSHYKSIHIDLQSVVREVLVSAGRSLAGREDFSVTRTLAHVNPKARKHLAVRSNLESLLVFD